MISQFFFATLSLFLFVSCNKSTDTSTEENNPSTSINKIMHLGASRVEGDRPQFESYRYELWKHLVDGSWDFDYIGSMDDPASYPDYADLNFDNDHEGRGGWTSEQISNGIDDWLSEAGELDIVLFSSPGGNDALEGLPIEEAITNINLIIDAIQSANPNVTIIIEQLAPARADAMTPELTTYFNQIKQDILLIASEQSTSDSEVLAVDMSDGFEESFFADEVHYNEAGAVFIANRYYDVLINVLQ